MAMAMEWTEQQKREMYEDGVRSPALLILLLRAINSLRRLAVTSS